MKQTQPLLSQQTPSERIDQMQQEINRLRAELEHSERLATLGFLSAGTAHEINNVLTPVLAYAQLAGNNPSDADFQAKALHKIILGVQTAAQIAQAVLGFAGRHDEPQFANVRQTLDLALECIGRDPRKDKIKVDIDIPATLTVQMRPLALQQVMMNLILNARSAMAKRGGVISIRSTQEHNDVKLVFADNGPGIAPHLVERVFEPFVSDSQRARGNKPNGHQGGYGLGLPICKRLVDDAGGTICVETNAGSGTIFTISLPKQVVLRASA